MADDGDESVAPTRPRMKPILLYEELVLGGVTMTGVKYSCLDVCARFLACGASNGSVYIFARSQKKLASNNVHFRLLKMIAPPSDRHPVACLSFCPAQRFLVVGTSKGAVYAISLQDPARIGEKIEFSHSLHQGFSVTSFLWDKDGFRVFSACSGGTVAQTSIRAGMSVLFGSTTTEFLLKEDTSIVQLDLIKSDNPPRDCLLVSSQTRVLLLNLMATDSNGVIQIGSKLRQGNFGACFFLDQEENEYKVFSTRPGRRVWVGDALSGTVSSTLKFSLNKPPEPFFQGPNLTPREPISIKSMNLSKVHLFKYIHESMDFTPDVPQLLSWSPGTSALFFVDPIGVDMVEWHIDLGEIHDLKVLEASVFAVLHGDPCRVAIVRACAAVEFLELAVSNDLAQSIDLVVKYNIYDLALLLNLQCKWAEHIKSNPDDAPKVPEATLKALEEIIDVAATLIEEQTKSVLPTEADIAPPHIIFKPRKELPAITSPKNEAIETQLQLKMPRDTSYGQLNDASKTVYLGDATGSSRLTRIVDIHDLAVNDKVIDEAWRASHLPPPSEAFNYTPPTLFGETLEALDFESHITNATSSLVSLLPDLSFMKRDSTTDFVDEESFPPFEDTPIKIRDSNDSSLALRITMAVDKTAQHDASLIVPEAIALTEPEACIDLYSDTEVVLEAISLDLWASQMQLHSGMKKYKELSTFETTPPAQPPTPPNDDSITLPLIPTPDRLISRLRSLSETKRQLIERTVQKQMGVYPSAQVDWKWNVGGSMQVTPEITPYFIRPLKEVEDDFAQIIQESERHQKLMLWPTAELTRSAASLLNHYIHHGNYTRMKEIVSQWLNTFDPTIDVALIEKRKAIEQIKRSKMSNPAPLEEELPLTRNDWRLVRALVTFYFVLHTDVSIQIQQIDEAARAWEWSTFRDLGITLHISETPATSVSLDLNMFTAKYGMYLNLDLAAQVCSALHHAPALEAVLNLAIKTESLVESCDELLMLIAEGKPFELENYNSLCLGLHVLNVLLKKAPSKSISWCVRMYPCVTPWNVQCTLFGSQFSFEIETSSGLYATYYKYLVALLLDDSAQQLGVGRDAELLQHCLAMCFMNDSVDDKILLQVLKDPDTFEYNRGDVWELCMQHSHWKGVFQLVLNSLAASDKRSQGLTELRTLIYTLLQSKQFNRLEIVSDLIYQLVKLPDHSPLLHCVLEEIEISLQSSNPSKYNEYVKLLHTLFDATGIHSGLLLLESYQKLVSVMPLKLYQALVDAQRIHQEQLQQVCQLLEGIDTYVWSCSRRHHMGFPPQIEALFRIECGFYDTWDKNHSNIHYKWNDQVSDVIAPSLTRSFESRNSDWGGEIQLHDWNCSVCNLPLVYIQGEKNIDAILLSCGHAYHDLCLPDRCCPICVEENFGFYLDDE
ncbi:hypothetical protein THRCLA_08454 [Thraustotheca clavata]|uniref:RING-type domain-containing protein n=1 Tax=Thraustotheca clavata TaxID=74557 RepID=A0A1V9Z609_9STRA|nr:hypothetical protein THRCLA_08454 [Thraustotheca clavata]